MESLANLKGSLCIIIRKKKKRMQRKLILMVSQVYSTTTQVQHFIIHDFSKLGLAEFVVKNEINVLIDNWR